MDKERKIDILKQEIFNRGIEEEPSQKAAEVAEFFYRTSRGRAGRRVSQILKEGDLLNPDSPRKYKLFQEYEEDSKPINPDDAYKRCDNVCVGLEVLLHFEWIYTDNSIRYSLSGKGLEEMDSLFKK